MKAELIRFLFLVSLVRHVSETVASVQLHQISFWS